MKVNVLDYYNMKYGYHQAFGGIVVNKRNQVLLVKPANGFSDTAWTFPKGMPKVGEKPIITALREVEEEAGAVCDTYSWFKVPGTFNGSCSKTEYYLMSFVKMNPALRDGETEKVKWACFSEAVEMIQQTKNDAARNRDLAVLCTALSHLTKISKRTKVWK